MGDIQFVVDAPVGIAGGRGTSTTVLVEADIPSLLHKGALESLEGKSDIYRNGLRAGMLGIQVPSDANVAGHFVLGVAPFDVKAVLPMACRATRTVSRFPRNGDALCPEMATGGTFFLDLWDTR